MPKFVQIWVMYHFQVIDPPWRKYDIAAVVYRLFVLIFVFRLSLNCSFAVTELLKNCFLSFSESAMLRSISYRNLKGGKAIVVLNGVFGKCAAHYLCLLRKLFGYLSSMPTAKDLHCHYNRTDYPAEMVFVEYQGVYSGRIDRMSPFASVVLKNTT